LILDKVPDSAIAGDTWRWTLDLADFPAPTWDATIYFQNTEGSFNQAAVDDSTRHAFTISATTTTGKKAGKYKWFVRVTDGTNVETPLEGWIDVKPDPSKSGATDHRSQARKMLDAVEATLLGRATSDQLAMSINGRSLSRIPLMELKDWRAQLRQEVATAEGRNAGGKGRRIKVRLTRA
jgi:hypothetical protein